MPTFNISAYRSFTFDRVAEFAVEAETADAARVNAEAMDWLGLVDWKDGQPKATGQEDFHPTQEN